MIKKLKLNFESNYKIGDIIKIEDENFYSYYKIEKTKDDELKLKKLKIFVTPKSCLQKGATYHGG